LVSPESLAYLSFHQKFLLANIMDIWTQIDQFLNHRIWGNRLENIFWCVGLLVAGLLLRRILSIILGHLLF
jgi:hypothetical protein